jgi:hypothetical protein
MVVPYSSLQLNSKNDLELFKSALATPLNQLQAQLFLLLAPAVQRASRAEP